MKYTVMANTGTSLWQVAEVETSHDVETYLMSQSAYRLEIQSGAAGVFQAAVLAEKLSNLVNAQLDATVMEGDEMVHREAISQVLSLMRMITVHHGASIVSTASMQPADEA